MFIDSDGILDVDSMSDAEAIRLEGMSEAEVLQHYGIKGMKWGLRKSKSVTGVGRLAGGRIDQNDRMAWRIKEAQKGKGLLRDRVGMKIDRAILGKEAARNYQNYKLKDIKSQTARIKAGKRTTADKLQILFATPWSSMVISNRPK